MAPWRISAGGPANHERGGQTCYREEGAPSSDWDPRKSQGPTGANPIPEEESGDESYIEVSSDSEKPEPTIADEEEKSTTAVGGPEEVPSNGGGDRD